MSDLEPERVPEFILTPTVTQPDSLHYEASQSNADSMPADLLIFVTVPLILFIFLLFCTQRFFSVVYCRRGRGAANAAVSQRDERAEPEYHTLILCLEGTAGTDSAMLCDKAARLIRDADNLYIPGLNRRDGSAGDIAWSVHTAFPSEGLNRWQIYPQTGWYARPDIVHARRILLCITLCYTRDTPQTTLQALVDEACREIHKSCVKGGRQQGREGYTFCLTRSHAEE